MTPPLTSTHVADSTSIAKPNFTKPTLLNMQQNMPSLFLNKEKADTTEAPAEIDVPRAAGLLGAIVAVEIGKAIKYHLLNPYDRDINIAFQARQRHNERQMHMVF